MADEPEELIVLTAGPSEAGERLDVVLARRLATAQYSRSKLQKLVEAGAVTVNGGAARAKQLLASGDEIVLVPQPPAASHLQPVAMALDILYEDAVLLVINKPAGLTVHPGAGETGPTLVEGVLGHLHLGMFNTGAAATHGPLALRPGIVHRLDKDTTGALVVAKTEAAHLALARQFHDKTNLREYVALLDGYLESDELVMESYLHRDPRLRTRFASMPVTAYESERARHGGDLPGYRYARSLFKRKATYGERLTLATVKLYTGRTHQIRVHASALGMPLVGDQVYGHPRTLPRAFSGKVREVLGATHRQMLHARLLGFEHPLTGARMVFEAPMPDDFQALLDALAPLAAQS